MSGWKKLSSEKAEVGSQKSASRTGECCADGGTCMRDKPDNEGDFVSGNGGDASLCEVFDS